MSIAAKASERIGSRDRMALVEHLAGPLENAFILERIMVFMFVSKTDLHGQQRPRPILELGGVSSLFR